MTLRVLHALPPAHQASLLGKSFFPNLISGPFMVGLHVVFYLAMAMCVVAAIASLLRGQRYIYGQQGTLEPVEEDTARGDGITSPSRKAE
ncbi:hypothetical protein [Ktedonosporobacter rubrisoli]|uniref:hypothetical protein n=1 Tax=Ktedonosporobacter rubrisoli TaxID=2509675 RepID=UPI001A929E4B|nr:hypothetical protein [Ktedonosporobacter rubrisoli]